MIWPFARARAEIRPLDSGDAEDCAGLHASGFAHPWSAQDFETLLSSSTVDGSAAVLKGRPMLGFVVSREAAGEAEILTLVVRSDRRRQGLGRHLMGDLLARLAAGGTEAVFLEVDEANAAANALYRELGFVRAGMRTAYYRRADGSTSNALILRRLL